MTLLQIVCDNCGAKYRLPETFTGAKAKCKQCNSAIDVAAQRAAAQAPAAAAAPAAARPARTASPARPAPSARSSAGAPRSSVRSPSVRAPRREAEAPPPTNKKPLIFAGIGGVAVIVVVAVLLNSGKQPPKSGQSGQVAQAPANNDAAKPAPSPAASKPADSQPPADASAKKRTADMPSSPAPLEPTAPAAQKPQGKSPDKQAPKPAAQPADTSSGVKSATSGAGATGKSDAIADERTRLQQKEFDAWMKLGTKSLADVLDPKKVTQPLDFPPEVSDDDKKKLASLYQEAKDGGGGARSVKLLKEIGKMGVGGLYHLINQLREIDYKNYDDVVWAEQINMQLLELTMGVNTGFVPVEAGPDPNKLDPRIAQWDALTVEKWIGGAKTQWPSKAKWDEFIANKKAKKDKELDEGDTKK
jgi:hypothetical protein